MSKRNDITDGIFATTKKYGLVYTEELGWNRSWGMLRDKMPEY